jgi:hypothetical protein
MIKRLSIIFGILICFAGCKNKGDDKIASDAKGVYELEEGYTSHPHPDKLPHSENEASVLEISEITSENLSLFPELVQTLYKYLNRYEEESISTQDIDVMVTSHHSFHVASVNGNRIIILDPIRNRLLEYDVDTKESVNLAPEGRGPGDILFTRDIRLFNNHLYVAMQGFRISVFDCSESPCEYERTISTEYNNYSVAPSADKIIVLGLYPFGLDQDPDPTNVDQNALHMINQDGQVTHSFSSVYQDPSPIVREAMNANGTVHYLYSTKISVLTYPLYPFFYVYDNSGNLTEKYKIPGFKQGFYEFNEQEGIGRYRYNDSSDITYTSKIVDSWILFQIRNRANMEREESGRVSGEYRHSYFTFNVETGGYYHIGDDQTYATSEGRAIFVTDHGVIVNEGGKTLSLIRAE